MTVSSFNERRRYERNPVVRACKVRDLRTARYLPAQTTDLSVGGALIRVERSRQLGPGDELDIFLGREGEAVLSGRDARRAIVRRVIPIDSLHQAVALEFGPGVEAIEPVHAVAA